MMPLMGFFGMLSGGFNAGTQQNDINKSICSMVDSMNTYKTNMKNLASVLNAENSEIRQEINDLALQISTYQDSIRQQHQQFKDTYKLWSVTAIIFMIILIFIFASKIIILKASTTK